MFIAQLAVLQVVCVCVYVCWPGWHKS